MPRISKQLHTTASLREALATLDRIASQVRSSIESMETVPTLDFVEIQYETSLIDGTAFLQQWADAARDAIREAKRKSLQAVSGKSDTCPIAGKTARKSTETKRRSTTNKKPSDTGSNGATH